MGDLARTHLSSGEGSGLGGNRICYSYNSSPHTQRFFQVNISTVHRHNLRSILDCRLIAVIDSR